MDISSMTTVIAIVVICYLIGLAAKTIPAVKDNYIPVIVGTFGGVLGANWQMMPNLVVGLQKIQGFGVLPA